MASANTSRNSSNLRLYLLGAILVVWCGAICVRLVYLQIVRYGDFQQRAARQQQRTVEVSAKRGLIYDRSGHELAMTISVDSVFAVPTETPNLANAISLIARITRDDPRELLARCQAARTFCWVARKADAETADRIRSLNLRGIYFQKESRRFYPKRDLAAQVLGYVGMDDEGLSGIERQFDDQLRGKPGRMLISVDARRKWFGSVEKQPEPGQNVVLTIDEKIQYIAERELDAAMAQTHAKSGTIVVENPRTGEILALANRPTYNPNNSDEIKPAVLRDHAVSDVFEPGSTFKLVTIAAALDEKLTRPDEMFDCQNGSIVINGLRIHDHKSFGMLSVRDILAHSSDVGAIKIALRLGEDRFYKYIRSFGFGQPTGIELPAETRGLTKPVNRWSKVSIGAISMGQEIGISPIQLAAMVSAIANDGVWIQPRVVAATTEPSNTPQTVAFHPGDERRVIAPMTAAQMKQMMEHVVLHGTGRNANLEGYSVAGKTGTAQKFDPLTNKYSHTKFVASFAGFAPVNNPAITVAVILDSPVAEHVYLQEGGWTAAPVFKRVAQQVLEYLHTPHDVEIPASRQVLFARMRAEDQDLGEGSPDRLGETLEVASAGAADVPPATSVSNPSPAPAGIVPAAMRETVASAQVSPREPEVKRSSANVPERMVRQPAPAQPLTGTVVLNVEQGGIVVPSFLGKSVRGAIELAQENGLDLDALGSGIAQDQSPGPGAHVAAGSRIVVRFGR